MKTLIPSLARFSLALTGISAGALWCRGQDASTSPTGPTAPNNAPITMSEFDVTSTGDVGYLSTNTISGSRTALPIRDTPMSLDVINQDLIADTGSFDLRNMMQYDSSVTMLTSLNGPQFNIRGAEATRYIDGFYQSTGLVDPIGVERIEVLQGATAILYGVSSPGGIVNTISKKPLFADAADIGFYAGSDDFYRFDADVNAVSPDSDNLGLRVMAAYSRNQEYGWIKYWKGKEKYIDPTASWRITPKTTLNLTFESYEDDSSPLGQVIRYGTTGNAPDINYGVGQNFKGPDSNQQINELDWRSDLEQQLWTGWVLRAAGSYDHYILTKDELGNSGRIAADGVSQTVFPRYYDYDDFNTSGQIELVGNFDVAGVKNRLLAGYEGTQAENTEYEFASPVDTVIDLQQLNNPNIFPSLGVFPQNYTLAEVNTKLINNYGAWYASTQTWFFQNRGLLLLGFRDDTADSTSASRLPGGTSTSIRNIHPSPQAGLSFRVVPSLTVYGLYSTSMYPNSVTNQYGQPFAPQLSSNVEAGVKGDFWNERLSFSSAVFQLEQSNIAELSPFTPGLIQYYILSGENRSRGAEFNGIGTITKNWQILYNYTYLDARVVANTQTPTAVGTVSNYSPRHSMRLWTRYNFSGGILDRLWIGAGMIYQSVEFAGSPSSIPFDGYHVYNAAIGYHFNVRKHVLSLQVNANNVLNEAYVADPDAYGAPRYFTGSINLRF